MRGINEAFKILARLSVPVKIICFAIASLIMIYFVKISFNGGDFGSYMEAASKMLDGKNIYDPPYVHLRYSYSPFWAMLLMPLALFPPYVAVFIWLILNVLMLSRSIILIRKYFGIKDGNTKKDLVLWGFILLFMSRFIELNFQYAQMTIFLLWSILESVVLSDKGKETRAGILLGLSISIKIMPLVMIPYFIYRRRFLTAFASILTIIGAFFLPLLYTGRQRFAELNSEWYHILSPDNPDFKWDIVAYFPHNLSALLYRLLTKSDAPYLKNIFSLDYDAASKWVWAIIALFIFFTLFFLGTRPFKQVKSRAHVLYELSYIILIMPLIFPHQMKYAFYFLMPAVCCLIAVIMDKYNKGERDTIFWATLLLVFVSFALCTLTTDLLIGIKYSVITQYLKTITIGTLLLIPALAMNRKYYIE